MNADWHWQHFQEFIEYNLAVGGSGPHARYIGELARGVDPRERLWRAGVYVAIYTAPGAEAVYRAWPYDKVLAEGHRALRGWLETHWAGIPLRRERRAVRTPEKLSRCLTSYAAWTEYALMPIWGHLPDNRHEAYEVMWKAAGRSIYGMARYSLMRLLAFYERYCEVPITMPDIRPIGGWSPRETLCLLAPGRAEAIAPHSNEPSRIQASNEVAAVTKNRLALHGLDISWFDLEVALCEYRQSAINRRQYPGRSIDSELGYLHDVERAGYERSDIWEVRARIHPRESLGELYGWDGTRDECALFLGATGHTWSDLLWEYASVRTLTNLEGQWKEATDARDRIRDLARQALGESAHRQPVAGS